MRGRQHDAWADQRSGTATSFSGSDVCGTDVEDIRELISIDHRRSKRIERWVAGTVDDNRGDRCGRG